MRNIALSGKGMKQNEIYSIMLFMYTKYTCTFKKDIMKKNEDYP